MTGPNDRAGLLAVAEAAARAAGAELLRTFESDLLGVQWKTWQGERTVVTDADFAADRAIREVLAERVPGHTVYSEEFPDEAEIHGPDVWVIDGDGSLMMQLGSLGTIAGAAPSNFLHIVIHNGVYETSGSQPLPSQQQVDFAQMAEGAGYAQTASFGDAEEFDSAIDELLAAEGPTLVQLYTRPEDRFYSARPTPPGTTPALARMWPPVAEALK